MNERLCGSQFSPFPCQLAIFPARLLGDGNGKGIAGVYISERTMDGSAGEGEREPQMGTPCAAPSQKKDSLPLVSAGGEGTSPEPGWGSEKATCREWSIQPH